MLPDEAQAQGVLVLGLMHHGIVEHFPNMDVVFSEYLLADWEEKADAFAQMGIQIVFTGHHHATDIALRETPDGPIIDVQTGSPVTWQCPYRINDLNPQTGVLNISNQLITEIDYDLGGMDFQEASRVYQSDGKFYSISDR